MIISGGGDYYGTLQEFDGVMVPHGMGVCKYSDYNEHGMFQNGILCGIGIVESGSRIQVGMTYNKVINGWGLIVDKSEITFGIFDDSKIQVNLSSLVRSFFLKIIDDVHQHHEKLFVIGKKKEIFIGISEVFI